MVEIENVEVLDLASNRIADMHEVQRLAQLPKLHTLTLRGNPVCDAEHYRMHVVNALPQISVLDDRQISPAERQRVQLFFADIARSRERADATDAADADVRRTTVSSGDLPPSASASWTTERASAGGAGSDVELNRLGNQLAQLRSTADSLQAEQLAQAQRQLRDARLIAAHERERRLATERQWQALVEQQREQDARLHDLLDGDVAAPSLHRDTHARDRSEHKHGSKTAGSNVRSGHGERRREHARHTGRHNEDTGERAAPGVDGGAAAWWTSAEPAGLLGGAPAPAQQRPSAETAWQLQQQQMRAATQQVSDRVVGRGQQAEGGPARASQPVASRWPNSRVPATDIDGDFFAQEAGATAASARAADDAAQQNQQQQQQQQMREELDALQQQHALLADEKGALLRTNELLEIKVASLQQVIQYQAAIVETQGQASGAGVLGSDADAEAVLRSTAARWRDKVFELLVQLRGGELLLHETQRAAAEERQVLEAQVKAARDALAAAEHEVQAQVAQLEIERTATKVCVCVWLDDEYRGALSGAVGAACAQRPRQGAAQRAALAHGTAARAQCTRANRRHAGTVRVPARECACVCVLPTVARARTRRLAAAVPSMMAQTMESMRPLDALSLRVDHALRKLDTLQRTCACLARTASPLPHRTCVSVSSANARPATRGGRWRRRRRQRAARRADATAWRARSCAR